MSDYADYLLISFWFTRVQAANAALKAMLVNQSWRFGFAFGYVPYL